MHLQFTCGHSAGAEKNCAGIWMATPPARMGLEWGQDLW